MPTAVQIRWLVRWPREGCMHVPPYEVFRFRRPYFNKRAGRWVGKAEEEVCPGCLETVLPKRFHLKPGGGPVELKT
jgi:hypothetical protein